jgi:hypothetical protein
MRRILLENPEVVMTTLTTAQEGRRTFILTMAASLALLSTVGLMYTLSDADRPAPVLADRTPAGVRDAVIIPVDQYDSMENSPVVAIAATEPTTAPAVPATAKPLVVKASLNTPKPVRPIKTTLALAADTRAAPAADEVDTPMAAPGHPIKVALAMAPGAAEAETVR